MDAQQTSLPTSFWVFSCAAMVWNLLLLVIYYQHVTTEFTNNPAFTEAQQEFLTSTPVWVSAAYGTAVTFGILASAALLLRSSWAVVLYAISLAGVVAQDIYAFGIADAMSKFGPSSAVLPALIFIVAVLLIVYSRSAARKGWLR